MTHKNKEYLGRKILDLIEENDIKIVDNEEVYDIDLRNIIPNPNQPRSLFKEEALNELAKSIEKHGVIQPIILRPNNDGTYMLIAGERRVRASKIAEKSTIPAIVRDYNAINSAELSILENLQREDLTAVEEGIAYKTITSKLSISHAKLAEQLGKSRSHVTNMIGLVNLPNYIIDALNEGKLSMGHARVLSKIKNKKMLDSIFSQLVKNKWNVRKLEDVVRSLKLESSRSETDNNHSKYLQKIFKNSSNVKVKDKKIVIEFNDNKKLKQFITSLKVSDDHE